MSPMKHPSKPATAHDGTVTPDLFASLRDLLLPYSASLQIVHDEEHHFYANCQQLDAKGKAQFFGAVKVSGRKHAFHFMPIYNFPELLADISPELKKRMQGKSCFNFEKAEPALLDELKRLVERGAARYIAAGNL